MRSTYKLDLLNICNQVLLSRIICLFLIKNTKKAETNQDTILDGNWKTLGSKSLKEV